MKKLIGTLLIVCGFACASIFAQKIEAFAVGEKLIYEGKYSKAILRGVAAADLNFAVERAPNSQDFLIKSEARSKGTLVKLFLKFYQNIESTVDGKNFSVKRTVKRDEQSSPNRKSACSAC